MWPLNKEHQRVKNKWSFHSPNQTVALYWTCKLAFFTCACSKSRSIRSGLCRCWTSRSQARPEPPKPPPPHRRTTFRSRRRRRKPSRGCANNTIIQIVTFVLTSYPFGASSVTEFSQKMRKILEILLWQLAEIN